MKNNVLAQLKNVQSSITSTLEVCLKSNKVKELTEVLNSAKTKTTEALASVSDHPQKRNLPQTKKSLTIIDNLLSGLLEGLASRELPVKEFRAQASNLQTKFLPRFEESISTEVDKFKVEAGVEDEADEELTEEQQIIRNAILAASDSESEEEEEEEDAFEREQRIAARIENERAVESEQIAGDVERRLARLRALRKELPERMKTPYSVLRLPVVPNFETESAKNPVLLDKLSIPFTEIPLGFSGRPTGITNAHKMERYVIFEQQMILLVSKDYVTALLERKTEERDEENKEDIGERKGRIKSYKARVENMRTELESANGQITTLKSEVARITATLKALSTDATFKQQLASLDAPEKALTVKIKEIESAIKAAGEDVQERDKLKAQLRVEKNSLYKKRLAKLKLKPNLQKKVDRYQKEEVALDQQQVELEKQLKIAAELEAKIASAEAQRVKSEESLKVKRKEVKRSGAPITPEDYARSVLSVMNERSGSKYALVTPIPAPNPRNSRGILCFWIMPSSKLSAMMKATGGKAKVKEWDFPFENERHVTPTTERKGWIHPSDDKDHPEFLEFAKNSQHRPAGWKSRYGKPVKRPD